MIAFTFSNSTQLAIEKARIEEEEAPRSGNTRLNIGKLNERIELLNNVVEVFSCFYQTNRSLNFYFCPSDPTSRSAVRIVVNIMLRSFAASMKLSRLLFKQYSKKKNVSTLDVGPSTALTFMEFCRRPKCEIPFDQAAASTVASDQYRKNITQVDSVDQRVKMFVLPNGLKWPSFYASKQKKATAKHLFFQRVSQTHKLRFDATVDLLRRGEQIVSTGVAGIGKSAELNAFLMEFLKHVGEPGWPPEVWYRFDDVMMKFSLKKGVPSVDIIHDASLKMVARETLKFRDELTEKLPVLLLDLGEVESNPRSYIPTLIQLSNRDVYEVTKDLHKGRATYMLVNPPTCEDMCTMAVLEKRFAQDSVFKDMDESTIIELVTKRVNIVGPIPRSVFQSEEAFAADVDMLNEHASLVFNAFKEISESNVPKEAKHYIAPFVEDESVVPFLTQGKRVKKSLKFLSPYISMLIGKVCTTRDQHTILDQMGYRYQVQEAIVQYGLMRHDFDMEPTLRNDWLVDRWLVYRNPAPNDRLAPTDLLEAGSLGIPTCTSREYFDGMYLKMDVRRLKENVLYISRKHNGALYDCMCVDHSKETVFMFQCSDLNPDQHSLNVRTIHEVMRHLEMLESEYRIRYIYCCPSKQGPTTGCKLSELDDTSAAVKSIVTDKFSIFIARINFFPSELPHLIV